MGFTELQGYIKNEKILSGKVSFNEILKNMF